MLPWQHSHCSTSIGPVNAGSNAQKLSHVCRPLACFLQGESGSQAGVCAHVQWSHPRVANAQGKVAHTDVCLGPVDSQPQGLGTQHDADAQRAAGSSPSRIARSEAAGAFISYSSLGLQCLVFLGRMYVVTHLRLPIASSPALCLSSFCHHATVVTFTTSHAHGGFEEMHIMVHHVS